jgi:hypothetical protein
VVPITWVTAIASPSAPGAEQDGGDQTAFRVRQDDAPDHLPPREAEPDSRFLDVDGHLQEQVTADCRGDRDDHDRQDEDGREQRAARDRARREERRPPEGVVQPWAELVVDDRPEDEDPPEPEHDARNRGEHLDERADDSPDAPGRELAQIQPDRQCDRRREEESETRHVQRRDEEVQRSELVRDGVPGLVRQEPDPEGAHRWPRVVDDLVDDQGDQRDDAQRGESRDPPQREVAQTVAERALRFETGRGRVGDRCAHRA